jgi:hypothetical protein
MQSHYWKIVIVFLALVSCQTKNPNEFDFSKLIGRWEYTDPKSHQIEQWNSESDSSLVGKGFVLEQGDTTFIEFLALKKINGVWNYIAQVPSQNEQKEVYFRLTSQSASKVEFSNPQHDFPQKIVYVLQSDNTMQVYIEGPQQGKVARITFDFSRSALP